MAYLISATSGNWTDPTTWRVGYTPSLMISSPTSITNGLITPVPTASPPFLATTDVTWEGVALYCSSRSAGDLTSVSLTVTMLQSGSVMNGSTVSISLGSFPDIDFGALASNFWVYFKFLNPLSVIGSPTVTYSVRASSLGTNNVGLAWGGTYGFVKMLVTNIQSSPSDRDSLIVVGNHYPNPAAPAAMSYLMSTISVIMNNTTETFYGNGGAIGATFPSLEIGKSAILSYATQSNTHYKLNCFGNVIVAGGGVFNMGTTLSPMPDSSTASLIFVSASAADVFGLYLRQYSYIYTHGASKSYQALLSLSLATSSTSITTSVATNWKAGDRIVISGSTPSITNLDLATLSNNAVGTTLNITPPLSRSKQIYSAPSGLSNTEIEVINLTRNVRILGRSTATYSLFNINGPFFFDIRNTEFASMRLFQGYVTVGGFPSPFQSDCLTFRGCSFRDLGTYWLQPTISGNSAGLWYPSTHSYIDSVFFNMTAFNFTDYYNFSTTSSRFIMRNCWGMSFSPPAGNGFLALTGDASSTTLKIFTFEDCRISHVNSPANFNGVITLRSNLATQIFSQPFIIRRNVFKNSNLSMTIGGGGSTGFYTLTEHDFSDNKFYHNIRGPILVGQGFPSSNLTIRGLESFGNVTDNINFAGTANIRVVGATLWGGPWTTKTLYGVNNEAINWGVSYFDGIYMTAHSTGDVLFGPSPFLSFKNSTFGSTIPVTPSTPAIYNEAFISSSRHNQINGSHFYWKQAGTLRADTTIFRTPTTSLRMIPNNTFYKLETQRIIAPVRNGQTVVFGVWVRSSIASDGAAYNGSFPRLVCKSNSSTVIGPYDIILATASALSSGNWQYISGTLPKPTFDCAYEVVVDCDGTTGFVNVDDIYISAQNSTKGFKYFLDGAPIPSSTTQLGSSIVFL